MKYKRDFIAINAVEQSTKINITIFNFIEIYLNRVDLSRLFENAVYNLLIVVLNQITLTGTLNVKSKY